MALSSNAPRLRIRALFRDLLAKHVEFLLIGGVAATVYGAERKTQDLDVLLKRTSPNRQRAAEVLRGINAYLRMEGVDDETARRLTPLPDIRFFRRVEASTWRTDLEDLDMFESIPGPVGPMHFEDLEPGSNALILPEGTIKVASLQDIVASKRALSRPKDIEALSELDRILTENANRPQPSPSRLGGGSFER